MEACVKIGLIGDYDPFVRAHIAIPYSLYLASRSLSITFSHEWLGTEQLDNNYLDVLPGYDGLWCVPASSYKSMEGALKSIRYARENKIPFLGTCGGFQHTVIEYARNVLGKTDADHEEINPLASFKIIHALSCSLAGSTGRIILEENSSVSAIYNTKNISEEFNCSFGFNSEYESLLNDSDYRIAGRDENNEIRIIEHKTNPFLIATLFQPELSAYKDVVHPLIKSYLSAVFINKK